jgi:hypothetical protein
MSDLLSLTYGDIKEEFEKGIVPICLSLTRKKTGISFITFLGSWAVRLLREHLVNSKLVMKQASIMCLQGLCTPTSAKSL